MTTLSTAELSQLTTMRTQAQSYALVNIKSYYKIYETLADWLVNRYGVATTDSAVLWLRGATEANAGRGAMSELIRTYTATQYKLRYGTAIPDGEMQKASNAVAENLLKDLLGENDVPGQFNRWPKGQVPDIARIAEASPSELFHHKAARQSLSANDWSRAGESQTATTAMCL